MRREGWGGTASAQGDRDAEDDESGQAQADPHPGRRPVAETGGDDDPAQPRAEGVGEVEGRVVHRRGEARGIRRVAQQAHLQGRGDHGAGDADEEEGEDRDPGDLRERAEDREHERGEDHAADPGAFDRLVDEGTGDEGACGHAEAVDGEHPRDRGAGHVGDLSHRRGDVGVDGEHAAEADGTGEQGEEDLRPGQCLHLPTRRGCLTEADPGHGDRDHDDGEDAEGGDERVGAAPAEGVAQGCGDGDADDVGDRQAEHDPGHGPSAPVGGHERGGDDRPDAEVGPVGQTADEAGEIERPRIRGEHRGDVAEREEPHEAQQQRLAVHVGRDRRDERGADDDSEGVEGDRVPGLGDGDVQLRGDVGQQAHRRELGDADAEGADRECEHGELVGAAGHGSIAHGCPLGWGADDHGRLERSPQPDQPSGRRRVREDRTSQCDRSNSGRARLPCQ